MPYTPFATLSDDEFSTHLANKTEPTDEEIEAMLRIDRLLEEVAALHEQLGYKKKSPEVKYANAGK